MVILDKVSKTISLDTIWHQKYVLNTIRQCWTAETMKAACEREPGGVANNNIIAAVLINSNNDDLLPHAPLPLCSYWG
jgi:hypothetical protein